MFITACCPRIKVMLTGNALKHEGVMSGTYLMQTGFVNDQRYWMSSEGNAIWIRHTGDQWKIGYSEDLGTTTAQLYVPIKDYSKECPHENLQSNWHYWTGKNYVEDVSNFVNIDCLKGL